MSSSDSRTTAPPEARTAALRQALADKGLVPDGFLEGVVAQYEEEWTDRNGARVVAKAWSDPEYRTRLRADGTAACAELGYSGVQGEDIVVLEDTPTLHNVIVCTQCSCTAWPVLGLPPDWYKSVGGLEEARKNGLDVGHAFGGRAFGAVLFLSACSASRSR